MGAALSHDERKLTAHLPAKPAPKVAPAAPLRVKIDEIELFAVVNDYGALQDGFADRIELLNATLTEIDAAGKMTRGQTQKLLRKLDPDDFRPSARRKYSRGFGWETLRKTLEGTGLALALIVDNERFAPIKAQMAQRARPPRK
jgi:hypothetical protein